MNQGTVKFTNVKTDSSTTSAFSSAGKDDLVSYKFMLSNVILLNTNSKVFTHWLSRQCVKTVEVSKSILVKAIKYNTIFIVLYGLGKQKFFLNFVFCTQFFEDPFQKCNWT